MITDLARDSPPWGEITRLIDSTPLPRGKSRETVKRSDLAGRASYGDCASHARFFWDSGSIWSAPPMGCPSSGDWRNPKIGEREAAEEMLRHDRYLIHPGKVIVGDKGFAARIGHNCLIKSGVPTQPRSFSTIDATRHCRVAIVPRRANDGPASIRLDPPRPASVT